MILGIKLFLEEIIKEAEFNYAKLSDTKSKKIKCIKISAKKELIIYLNNYMIIQLLNQKESIISGTK